MEYPSSWSKVAPWVFLVVAVVATLATCMLVVDYTRSTAVFCDEVLTGCGAVKASSAASTFGIPTPVFGLAGLFALILFSASNHKIARFTFAGAGALGAAFSAYYIYSQVKLGQYCKYCLVVDSATLVMAGLALDKLRASWTEFRLAPIVRPALVGMVAAVTLGYGYRYVPPAPPPVQAEIDKTPRGQVCVVDFLDFECPFCREAHKQVHALIAREGQSVRLVRKHVPLRMHPHALPAARAAICAGTFGKEDAYADRLMEIDPETYTPQTLAKLATELGIDEAAFNACLVNPATEARIAKDRDDYKACKGQGLPMLFLGRERLVGLSEPAEFEQAYQRAKQ